MSSWHVFHNDCDWIAGTSAEHAAAYNGYDDAEDWTQLDDDKVLQVWSEDGHGHVPAGGRIWECDEDDDSPPSGMTHSITATCGQWAEDARIHDNQFVCSTER